ncbi:MAG: hypothetical protein D6725_12190 [Planctomycetota bacterium]|nr:MAG: hypothetical protein D6725_12190 [Planctomycetota bacterium]
MLLPWLVCSSIGWAGEPPLFVRSAAMQYDGERHAAFDALTGTTGTSVHAPIPGERVATIPDSAVRDDRESEPAETERTRPLRLRPPWGAPKVLRGGSSSAEDRKAAIDKLELQTLPEDRRVRAMCVVDRLSVYRRLPTISFSAAPEVYRYFLTVPHAAVDIWRALDVSEFRLWPDGKERFRAAASDGSRGQLLVLRRREDSVLVFCEGQYVSPLLPKPILARALIHLQFVFRDGETAEPTIIHTADLFVSLPSQPVETVARVIAPISNLIADRNFEEVTQFVQMMDYAMRRQPAWVRQLSTRLQTVSATDLQAFLMTTQRIHVRHRAAAARTSAKSMQRQR